MKESINIRLRALKESDSESLYNWVNDPEIVRYTYFYHPVSEMEHKSCFSSLPLQKDQILFGIETIEENKLIGTCGFHDINHICRKAELIIKISDKNEWGKGYGKDALQILIDFGFSDLNLRRIWLRVLADNDRAIKLYQNAGFITEGLLKEDHYIQGEYKDVIIMAFIRK